MALSLTLSALINAWTHMMVKAWSDKMMFSEGQVGLLEHIPEFYGKQLMKDGPAAVELMATYASEISRGRLTVRPVDSRLLDSQGRENLAVVVCPADTAKGIVTRLTHEMLGFRLSGSGSSNAGLRVCQAR